MAQWEKAETQAFWLAIELGVLLLFVGAFLYLTKIYIRKRIEADNRILNLKLNYQQQLLVDSINVQEKERKRIASDLHDELISQLNILMISSIDDSNNQKQGLQNCIQSARRISHDLSPPLLGQSSLKDLIAELIRPISKTFHFDFFISDYSDAEVEKQVKLHVLRILQEVLSNIIKYADASGINIIVRISKPYLAILIDDDGIGFDAKSVSHGLGLKNIEMRTQFLKGKYRLKSSLHSGTKYTFVFPLKHELNERSD